MEFVHPDTCLAPGSALSWLAAKQGNPFKTRKEAQSPVYFIIFLVEHHKQSK